jgi:hypothetical protein
VEIETLLKRVAGGQEGFEEAALDRVRSLRKELAAIADKLDAESKTIKITKGPELEGNKLAAASEAYELLRAYGGEPTLSVGGAFFQLAEALYRGATGGNSGVERACRRIFHAERGTDE